jgi:hypothetical protein
MRNAILLFLAALLVACLPRLAAAQAVLTLTSQDCVYNPGDNPAWAAATLEDSAWRPYSQWRADMSQPRLWVRCHLSLSNLLSVSQPVIQIRFYGPYELYLDGKLIGGSGNLATGDFSLNAIRSYTVAAAQIANVPQSIALRAFDRNRLYYPGPIRSTIQRPFRLCAGDSSLLEALRADEVVSGIPTHAVTIICYAIIGVLNLPLFALYAFDSSRKAVLLLAPDVVFLAVLRWNEFAAATVRRSKARKPSALGRGAQFHCRSASSQSHAAPVLKSELSSPVGPSRYACLSPRG